MRRRWRAPGKAPRLLSRTRRGVWPRTPHPTSRPVPRGTPLNSASQLLPSQLASQGLDELGVSGDRRELICQTLGRLAELLARWSARMNLTAHGEADAVMRRLILDALALDQALPVAASMVDLGAGAGFPGLPIAIMHPERLMTLVESRERRHHFQRAAVRELGIENVILRLGRAETLPAEPHPLVTAQALARPGQALVWMLRWAQPGGILALPLSADQPPPDAIEGLTGVSLRSYTVPLGGPRRTLWLARRAT